MVLESGTGSKLNSPLLQIVSHGPIGSSSKVSVDHIPFSIFYLQQMPSQTKVGSLFSITQSSLSIFDKLHRICATISVGRKQNEQKPMLT